MDNSRMDDFNLTISYPDTNKGKSIVDDKLDYALYNYNLQGEYLGDLKQKEFIFGEDSYTSLQNYTINIQSKLKKSCTLSDFLSFKSDCVDLMAKIIVGYKTVDAENVNSRKRYSSGLEEGSILKKIDSFKKEGDYLIIDIGGVSININFKKAMSELLMSIDSDSDGKVDESGYNYDWSIKAGSADAHFLEGDLDKYIEDNFNPQESNSNDFLSDRKASLRGLFRKVANEAIIIPLTDFGQAKVHLYHRNDASAHLLLAGTGYFDVKFLGNFNDTPDLKGLKFRIFFDRNKKIDEVDFLETNEGRPEYTSMDDLLEIEVGSTIYTLELKMPNIQDNIGGGDQPKFLDASDVIKSASYYDSTTLPESTKKEVKIHCISQGNINKFPEVKIVVSDQIMSEYPNADTIDKAIKKFQQEKLGFSGRAVDGILGPKSYNEMISNDEDSLIAKLYFALFAAFAKDAGHSENLEEDYIEAFYTPKFVSCSGRRRSTGGGVARGRSNSGGEGRSEFLGSLVSKKDCKKEYAELISTDKGKEKVRSALLADQNFMNKYKSSSSVDQDKPMKVLADYIKNFTPATTAECYIFKMIEENNTAQKAMEIGSLSSGRGGGGRFEALPTETQEQIEGCSGEAWTKEDISGLLKAIITGKTTGLNIGQKGNVFVAQVLNPNKLKNKFKDLLRKRKKGLDFPFLRSNKFYLKIIEDMSEDLAGYMNAFVKQDAKEIRRLLGKQEYEYLSDEKASPSIGRYCKTGLKRQDRSRLFMGFADLVNKNPMAIDSLAKKYIVKGYKDLDRMAPNLRESDTTDVRYTQDTWKGNAHDKTSGNILNDLVKLSNHLDRINEKAFSDRIEDIILETLGEK